MVNEYDLESASTIFASMDYGFKNEMPTLALKWFGENKDWINETIKHCGRIAEIDAGNLKFNATDLPGIPQVNYNISYQCLENKEKFHKLDRVRVLQKLASLLEQNALLFAQLDAMARKIPLRDVLEYDIPYFLKYFVACSSLPSESLNYVKPEESSGNTVEIMNVIPFHEVCWNISPYLIFCHNVKVVVDEKAALVVLLFMKLCFAAGVPNFAIKFEFKTEVQNNNNLGQSVAVIFDNIDVNTVVDSVIEGAWHHNGSVPWSIKRILVQESIHETYVKKFLNQMNGIRAGSPFDKLAVVTIAETETISNDLKEIVNRSQDEGFKVIEVTTNTNGFVKPVAILGRPQCLLEKSKCVPAVTIEVFRTVEESIKLIKNSNFYTCASLWTDSHAVLRTAAALLMNETNINTVWLNCHGRLDPTKPFVVQNIAHTVKKDLLSYILKETYPEIGIVQYHPETPDILTRVDKNDWSMKKIDDILARAEKAAAMWFKVIPSKRSLIFSAITEQSLRFLEHSNRSESLVGNASDVELIMTFLIHISSVLQNLRNPSISIYEGVLLLSNQQHGVVLLEIQTIRNAAILFQIIVAFIAFGNSLIIVTEEDTVIKEICECLTTFNLPCNLINVMKSKTKLNTIIKTSFALKNLNFLSWLID